MTSLNELAKEIRAINAANGWTVPTREMWPVKKDVHPASADYEARLHNFHLEQNSNAIVAKVALIGTEVSEMIESVRNGDFDETKGSFDKEAADVLIRLLDLTAGMGIDMDAVVAAKLEDNKKRGFKHGGKNL